MNRLEMKSLYRLLMNLWWGLRSLVLFLAPLAMHFNHREYRIISPIQSMLWHFISLILLLSDSPVRNPSALFVSIYFLLLSMDSLYFPALCLVIIFKIIDNYTQDYIPFI